MARENWTIDDIPDQTGRIAVVTGASAGLGAETARVLALKGARVIMAVRNTAKGEGVADAIRAAHPEVRVEVQRLDLASLASIKRFAQGTRTRLTRLDLLVNNAGVMTPPQGQTEDGFELQFGTNHLGHFALVGHLLPLLEATEGARLVVLSSMAHRFGKLDFDDLNWRHRRYKASRAYGDSKIANLHFAKELARRLGGNGPRVTAAHPGWSDTELQRHSGMAKFFNRLFAQSVDMGALPTLRAAFDPAAQPGDYFGPRGFMEMNGAPVKVDIHARARDADAAKRLWAVSEKLTGVSY